MSVSGASPRRDVGSPRDRDRSRRYERDERDRREGGRRAGDRSRSPHKREDDRGGERGDRYERSDRHDRDEPYSRRNPNNEPGYRDRDYYNRRGGGAADRDYNSPRNGDRHGAGTRNDPSPRGGAGRDWDTPAAGGRRDYGDRQDVRKPSDGSRGYAGGQGGGGRGGGGAGGGGYRDRPPQGRYGEDYRGQGGRGSYDGGGYDGYGRRNNDYDRPLDRRAIEEGRRRREEERAMGIRYDEHGNIIPKEGENTQDQAEEPAAKQEGEEEEDPEAAAMAAMMGFGGFETSKGKGVGPQADGAAAVHKQRTWRQYMNRRGGFNRPLDYMK